MNESKTVSDSWVHDLKLIRINNSIFTQVWITAEASVCIVNLSLCHITSIIAWIRWGQKWLDTVHYHQLYTCKGGQQKIRSSNINRDVCVRVMLCIPVSVKQWSLTIMVHHLFQAAQADLMQLSQQAKWAQWTLCFFHRLSC